MSLIVHGNSTEKYAREMGGNLLKIEGSPTKKMLGVKSDKEIIAIGGGSVIDAAKIIGIGTKNNRIVGIPTTASGAVETSHAVYWENHRKYSVQTPKPQVEIHRDFLKTLPKSIIRATSYDALSHAIESYYSKKATTNSKILALLAAKAITDQIRSNYPDIEKLIMAGNVAGRAIEITGTNVVHAISYPITGFYGISHGLAVGLILPTVTKYFGREFQVPEYKIDIKEDFDIGLLAKEAMTYAQIHDAAKDVSEKQVMEILRESL